MKKLGQFSDFAKHEIAVKLTWTPLWQCVHWALRHYVLIPAKEKSSENTENTKIIHGQLTESCVSADVP